jgi:hypothetical protein
VEQEDPEVPAPEALGAEEPDEEITECPDHQPSSFERDKPQSTSSSVCKYLTYVLIMIDALS